MAQWLSERSYTEMICLFLTVGMVVTAVVGAMRGRG